MEQTVDVVIGLDSGTTSTKAVAVTAGAVVRATASRRYPLHVPGPGRAELDPADLQTAAVETLTEVAALLADLGDRVVAVSLSGAMHGLVPMDADLAPLGPVVTWADGRAGREAAELAQASDGGLHRRTGTPVHPMSPLPKLMWWRHRHPEEFARVARWGGVKELVVSALCDAPFTVDASCASATGLYDIHAGHWLPEATELAGVRLDQLADVVPTTQVVGPLRPDVCSATGLPPGTPLVVGASDGTLANLGVGAVRPGSAAVSIGTSAALRAVRDRPGVDAAGRLFCYALTEDRWVLGGAVNNGGSVLDWLHTVLTDQGPRVDQRTGVDHSLDVDQGIGARAQPGAFDPDALLAAAAEVPAGSDGLLCLPYLLGERAPWWQPGLHAAWVGVRRDHTQGHLVRAAVEGVCQLLALVRDGLGDAGLAVHEVRATGGALESPVWTSVLAAALDLPVHRADSPEGTGTGAALLGHHALGALPDLDAAADLVALDDGCEPDPAAATTYRAMRPLVEQCTRALVPVYSALDELRGL